MKAYFLFIFFSVLMASCSFGSISGGKRLKVTTWNVQTFFDCVEDGAEYTDFVRSKKWNEQAYRTRLERLSSSMKKMNSDVFVLQEIENERVVYDIAALISNDWNSCKRYNYAVFSKQKESAIGCAVFSRLPLERLSAHGIYLDDCKEKMPSVRPLMQLSIVNGDEVFVLLVNHWKSKKGSDVSISVRKKQEIALGSRISALLKEGNVQGKKPVRVLACGDFNQDSSEFTYEADGTVKFQTFDNNVYLHEGLDCFLYEDFGTYFFRDEWSVIDHIFYSGDLKISDCWIETEGDWCDPETHIPYSYKVWTGSGYSDHLPVSCYVEF